MSGTLLAQTQLGADIDGEAEGDRFGESVSLSADGKRLAIGAVRNSGNGDWSGHVRVYTWSGTAWTQLGADIDGEAAFDGSGSSVSISADGNRVAIGAPGNAGNGSSSGQVRVYTWSGTAWTQLGADINGEAVGDESGWSVSMSADGNRVAIGARGADGGDVDTGHVRVYAWSGTVWTQLGTDIDGEAFGDQSGWSVSISADGNRVAIGAPTNISNGNGAGHVRVYTWSGTAWTQLGADIDGEGFNDQSGYSVSMSADGNRVAIGATGNSDNGARSGQVRVYTWSGTAWVQLGTDIDGEAAEDLSGFSVSMSTDGNRVAIGAIENAGNGVSSGHVRTYTWSGTAWTQLGADIDGEASGDQSGYSVSLSADGTRLAIGAPTNAGDGSIPGHVRAYKFASAFVLNAGLNDAWFNPATDGQGFFITVFPDMGVVVLSWFTYDTELPATGTSANLGDAGQRWLLAVGPFDRNSAALDIEIASGGTFDTPGGVSRRADGTITLTFTDCNNGTVEYNIPSIGRQGTVPITRVATDNVALCESLD